MKHILRGLYACGLASLVTPVLAQDSTGQHSDDIERHQPETTLSRSQAVNQHSEKSVEVQRLAASQSVTAPERGRRSKIDKITRAEELEEIVVTGTHLRNASNSASPVEVYDRNDIDLTGLGSVQEFVQRLPQNFNGGASEDTIMNIAGGGNADNTVSGAGVNLRGLGNDSTLVLVNGRRVASANARGNFVDISLIPLSAVERIEVVADGASAIYGSDAVGGVLNFILRRDFEGAESRLRYGSTGRGDTEEFQAGQTVGTNWGTGSALFSYEYFRRTALDANDRSYTRAVADPFMLLPEQERHGTWFTIEHATAGGIELFADASYSRRSSTFDVAGVTFTERHPAESETYGASVGSRVTLWGDANLEFSASHSASKTRVRTIDLRTDFLIVNNDVESGVTSIDGKLTGGLWSLPGGIVEYALGIQFREESFERLNLRTGRMFEPMREILAGFTEVRVPLIGSKDSGTANQVELILADRYENYSDFGSTNNPKIGVIWRPSASLNLRGTYGTSFKAPLLSELDDVPSQVVALPLPDPLVGGSTASLLVFGGNPKLRPEDARSWALGFQLEPRTLPGVRVEGNYYDIDYSGRITLPVTNVTFIDALRQEAVLGPVVIQRNPSLALVNQLVMNPTYINVGVDLADIEAIVDYRVQNLSEVTTSGIDFSAFYSGEMLSGYVEVGIAGTYILDFSSQFTVASPRNQIVDTPYNPVDLRLRGQAMITHGPVSAALFVNYVDAYRDQRAGMDTSVDAWITADATLGYELGKDNGLWSNLSFQLSVTNITDEEPPVLRNPTYDINFDGANANALGRFASLQVSKSF